jgi:hypothetical protein
MITNDYIRNARNSSLYHTFLFDAYATIKNRSFSTGKKSEQKLSFGRCHAFSNYLNRIIGFEHQSSQRMNDTFTRNITQTDFKNSAQLLFKIDFVLPFAQRFEHQIWTHLFNEIKIIADGNGHQSERRVIDKWRYVHVNRKPVSTKVLINKVWTDDEKALLKEKTKSKQKDTS